jgi:hypothetical protein
MRARVRTLGVEEHHFVIEKGRFGNCLCCDILISMLTGPETGADVYMTDVGGSRSQRAKWVPFFEDSMLHLCIVSQNGFTNCHSSNYCVPGAAGVQSSP